MLAPEDLRALVVLGMALAGVVGVGEALRAWAGWRPENSRRVVHAATGVLAAVLIPLFSAPGPVYLLAGAFAAANAYARRRRLLPGMHAVERDTAGTVIFPLALIAGLAVTWSVDPSRVPALQAAFLVLGLADPLAAIVGERARRPRPFEVAGHRKSLAGSAAFLVAAFALVAVALAVWGQPASPHEMLARALAAAVLATAAEALGTRGWDNLLVVLAVVAPLVAPAAGIPALAAAGAFALLAWRARSLDVSGALAAGLLGWAVLLPGNTAWAVPGIVFFVLSSLLSRAGRRAKAGAARLAAKTGPRDATQVLSNGGVAGALVLAYALLPAVAPAPALYWAFVGAFAAAAADTWATEIGTLVGGATRRLPTFARATPGESGGVSLAGTAGAVAGASAVFAAAWLAAARRPDLTAALTPALAAGIVVGGALAACLLDSVLGGTLQGRYRTADGTLADAPSADGRALPLAAGFRAVNNDLVNLACTAAGAAVPLAALS